MWYYTVAGLKRGPVTPVELKRLADLGSLKPTDLVWKQGLDKWAPAGIVKGLFPEGNVVEPPPLPHSAPLPNPQSDNHIETSLSQNNVPDHEVHEAGDHRVLQVAASGTAMPMSVRESAKSSQDAVPSDRLQSKSFLRGQHHPWRRFFAKIVDLGTIGIIPIFIVYIAGIEFLPHLVLFTDNPLLMDGTRKDHAEAIAQVFVGISFSMLWIPIDAFFLSVMGYTPGRWLYGISVRADNGSILRFWPALKRSALVALQGLALFTPFALFTKLAAYRRLTKTGTTLWDSKVGSIVTHVKWGWIRTIIVVIVTAFSFACLSVLNAIGGI